LLDSQNQILATAIVGTGGSYTIQVPGPLGPGPHGFSVQQVDQYGNVSTPSATIALQVISPPPASVTVTNVQFINRTVHRKKESDVVITFSGALSAAGARNLANYRLAAAGKDKKYGTRDDIRKALRSATYDPVAHTVTLVPKSGTISSTSPLQLRITSSG